MRYLTPLRKSISAFARHRLGGSLKPTALAPRATGVGDGFPPYLAGFLMFTALIAVAVAAGPFISKTRADESRPDLYVPYKDLAHLIEPQDKAVLMDRAQFDKLLVAAELNARQADTLELGQVKTAEYAAKIAGEELSLTGKLEVVSIGRGPVAVPLGFAGVGLTAVVLDGAPAPLGYDKDGRLTLIVNDKGAHNLEIAGTTKLTELAGGGMQFSISLPQAVAGLMKLTAAGDLEIHATVPASAASYDKQNDATSIELTIGGEDKLTVVLLGNGRQQDDRAILLGESVATVSLTRSHQVLSCLYTVQVLRRGVREVQFRLPAEWTITDVSSPSLVRWSVEQAGKLSTLGVRLGAAKVGATALHIKATALRTGQAWAAPHIILVDAAFQRGYLLLNTDEALGVRGEKVVDVRREDALAAALVPGLVGGATGPLYFHWGDNWSVNLELADVEPKRSIKERQQLVVSPQQVTLTGQFEVTAVERELFDLSFVLRGQAAQWQVKTVLVDNSPTGFEYRIEDRADRRALMIELPRPIQREKTANVTIVTQHVPSNWDWPGDAPDRSIAIPLIQSQAQTVSGYVSVLAEGDLDVTPQKVPDRLEPVPAGRMASLGMAGAVQHAYSNNTAVDGDIQLLVSRRRPRISAESVGLISVQGREFAVDWRIAYTISRASAKTLYLLVDKSLREEFKIASATVPIASKSVVQPGEKSIPLSDELAKRYNLYLLNLDHSSLGDVVVDVRYERPIIDKGFDAPLVRPICLGEISEQLAVQAAEESAVKVDVSGAKEIDAVDLPPLPAQAARILWAFRLDAPTTPAGSKTALILNTDVHESYEIPSALAVSARLTTYLDVDGGQRTQAEFSVANVGRQFLTIRLPQRAELWSLSVSGRQVKPQRSAAGDYEVSLGQLGRPVPVKVVYACRPAQADLESIELGRIELPGVQINQTSWTIIPPPGYRVTTQQTKMQTNDLTRQVPAYLKLYRLFTENVFTGSLLMPSLGKARHPIILAEVLSARASYEFPAVQKTPEKSVEAEEYEPPWVVQPPSDQPAKAKAEQVTQEALGIRLLAEGRFTLPVDLVPTAGAGRPAAFTGLGTAELTIGLARTAWMSSCWAVGFALIAAVGIALVRRCGRSKAVLIVAVLALASLLAVWRLGTVHFANGAFTAALCLIPFYVLTALVRLLLPRLHLNANASPASAIVGALLISVLCLGCSAHAAAPAPPIQPEPPKAPLGPAPVKEQQPLLQQVARPAQPSATNDSSPVIIPYDGDPTAPEDSNKVLISYARFIELWNLAHPNDVIDGPRPGTDVSLAAVRYSVTVEAEQLSLLLTADVRTYGRDWVVLPMPLAGLAVTQATFAGRPAQLHTTPQTEGKQSAPGNMVLMLPGRASGQLQIKALAKPEYFGRRGSAKLSLPPLPGAVMDVLLPQDDLELEVDQIESIPSPQKTNGAVKWIVPLGMTKELTLRWLPKAGGGAADRTLSAAAAHDVYAFHWAIVGVSKITYSFSGGEHDRFALLVPKGATLTEVKGTNIRDYRDLGPRTVDDGQFNLVEVRLHRPAKKQYDLTVRWLGELPPPDKPSRLLLVRADDVSRESGTVTLHSAGGMALKVAQVTGGRRTDIPTAQTPTDADLTADRATPVAAYYWPYRPFALSVQLSRLAVSPRVHLDQLVRVSSDATELLVQAKLIADQGKLAGPSAGKLFGASFTLPAGYELLSVVGPAVEGFYERSSDAGRFLHVKFDRGQQETKIALVLVRKDVRLEAFDVPLVTYIDSGGSSSQAPGAAQQGRLAVQVAASLDAKTLDSKSLKPIVPATLKDWLDSNQINAVQFAYSCEQANPSLRLDIRPQPTRVRVEVFAGLTVKTTAAVYTYRLRYNVAGSPIDNLTFSLPDEYASLVAVNSPALRSVTQSASADGWTSWKVVLVNEVTGDVDIAVNFALPIDASTKLLSVPRIRTDAPAGYRVVIAVQNMSRHDISVTDSTRLTELAVSEQQKLMSPQMTESLQYVFQSFEDNWSLGLGFTPAKAAARIQAVVDLLALTTVIDRNGRCRYEARLSLQNRSEQFLRVEVPQGLRLWSATVASQPVKPVTVADSAPGLVLIPLVKTSPGGLPYDVYLYFADEQAGPLIEPLNGIARLKPPAISIADVPVMRTTWSLLLPAGYRYMRPGGNMSPVAGTVEILSLDIDARLDQLKRLEKTYRDVAGSASRSEVVAQQNWSLFNQKLNADIQQAQSFLEANRGQVADEDYRRLSSKLGGQKQSQDVLFGDNTSYIQQQQEQTRYDLNVWLNDDAVNVGVSELVRNNALLQKPDFIGQGEQQQIARLTKELEVSQGQLVALQQQADKTSTEGVIALDVEAGKKPAIVDFGTVADDLLLARSDEKAEVGKLLGDLSQQSAAQLDRKQAQLKNQLDQLKDNRSQRYFQGPEQMAQTREPTDQFQVQAPAQQQAGRSRGMETAGADRTSGLYSSYNGVPESRSTTGAVTQPAAPGKGQMEAHAGTRYGMAVAGGASRPAEPQPPQSAAPGSGLVAGYAAAPEYLDQYQYVAKGTYSLPVTLPQGEVRLDFARSAGQAQLSIWAVPVATIRNVQATAAVVVALLIVLGIIKIWPATAAPISAKRAIIYLVLFLTLTLTLGLLGLVLTLLAIFAVEAIRAASLRKPVVL